MKSQSGVQDASSYTDHDDYLQLIFDNLEESIVLLDKNLVILQSNKAATEGIWAKAGLCLLPGLNILDSVAKERLPLLKEIFADVLQGNKRTTEYAHQQNGVVYYFDTVMLPARNSFHEIVGIIIYSKDVTERRTSENLLKEAEERWQFAFEASHQGAWDWDLQTNEIVYSGSYKKLYGFTEDEIANDPLEWNTRIHPDDRQRIEQDITNHLHSENDYYETKYRIRNKDGSYKWILARGKIIDRDSSGKALRMIGTHTDLTEAIRKEEEIKKSNERFLYAAKAASQALWEWDAVRGESYISPSYTDIFGWDVNSEQFFTNWPNYIHPDERKRVVDDYYYTLNQTTESTWQSEYRFLKADGSYVVISDRALILRDEHNNVLKVIGAAQDITEQKNTEAELFQSNERYAIMLKATNELLWEWDMKSNIVYRSDYGIQKVYGMEDDSAVRTHEQWLERVHPDDREAVLDSISKTYAGSHMQQFEIEYRFLRGDDTYAYIQGKGVVLKEEDGKPFRMIGTEQDITERKILEQELLKNELAYKKLINQATVDSQEQERSEIGRELHDNINQVLTTTKLYLELALANEDMAKELIKKSSRNISSAINEIRQLSRSLMDPTIGDLGIVDSINDLVENINLTRKITIKLDIDEEIETLMDKNQKLTIFRTIQESLNNIVRHANAKNVSIIIHTEEEHVRLEISDDGTGFSQASVKKGAGLKNITNRVYLINGNFEIKSEPGKGCHIMIKFPIKTTT
jgi:PAS domain S-box-containing protein